MLNADLTDNPNATYPAGMSSPISISKENITIVIKQLHLFKAAGGDGISFFILKCYESPLVSFI